MSALVHIALVGITSFEHSNFDTYFRLTDRPDQPFVLSDRSAACRLAVVNADDDAAVADLPDAGCDACLPHPLAAEALLKVVGDREVTQLAFAGTAQTSSTVIQSARSTAADNRQSCNDISRIRDAAWLWAWASRWHCPL